MITWTQQMLIRLSYPVLFLPLFCALTGFLSLPREFNLFSLNISNSVGWPGALHLEVSVYLCHKILLWIIRSIWTYDPRFHHLSITFTLYFQTEWMKKNFFLQQPVVQLAFGCHMSHPELHRHLFARFCILLMQVRTSFWALLSSVSNPSVNWPF